MQGSFTLKNIIKEFFSISIYPLSISMCLLFLHYTKKVSFPMEAAQFISFLAAVLVALACEKLLPHSGRWKRPVGRDKKVDVMTFLSTTLVVFPILSGLGAILAVYLMVSIAGSSSVSFFPSALPFILQVFAAAVIAEFGAYWLHRLSHTSTGWWKFHLVHHSASRIYWLNAYRSHPINISWHYLASVFMLLLIGTPNDTVLAYSGLASVVSVFQHANVSLKSGPLNYIFSTNEVHRWHHSTKLSEAKNNYGNVLMVWDLIFGTFYHKRGQEPAKVGLRDDSGVPVDSFTGLMVHPFKKTVSVLNEKAEPVTSESNKLNQ